MGRKLLARRGASLAALSVLTGLALPTFFGGQGNRLNAADVNNTLIEPASTLELSGLQSHFSKVVDQVSKSVVAISASCSPIASDDAQSSEDLNPQKLDRILSRTTRT